MVDPGDLSGLWPIAVPVVDPRPLMVSGQRPYSFVAECECPFDCLRDHENE